MGVDIECFVDPEHISSELICPICQNVLDNPVQTPSEHLFCEAELIEWLLRSEVCPVTKGRLDPSQIRKPGRIITNMIGELQRYCPNRCEGCSWKGPNAQVSTHLSSCKYIPRDTLLQTIEDQQSVIQTLRQDGASKSLQLLALREALDATNNQLAQLQEKVVVYEQFLNSAPHTPPEETQPVVRLKQLRHAVSVFANTEEKPSYSSRFLESPDSTSSPCLVRALYSNQVRACHNNV